MRENSFVGTGIVFLIILFGFFKFESFSNPIGGTMTEIEDVNFVGITGIDYMKHNNKLKVSVNFPDFKGQNQGTANKMQALRNNKVISAEGRTVFEAHRNLHLFSPKKFNYGHIEWVLMGESAARRNLADYIEFQLRDFERGWSGNVGIVKGSAEKFLLAASKEDKPTYQLVSGIQKESYDLSISTEVTFSDLLADLNQKNSAFCLPYFTVNKKHDSEGEPIKSKGLAVIKNRKLYAFLNKKLSRGVNWIKGGINSAAIVVETSEKQKCSLEVTHAFSNIKTHFTGTIPTADINIEVHSLIDELPATRDISMESLMKELVKGQKEFVKSEASAALRYSQANGVDILGISDSLSHQCPLRFKSIEKSWNKIFPKMKIKIYIKSFLQGGGLFRKNMIESWRK